MKKYLKYLAITIGALAGFSIIHNISHTGLGKFLFRDRVTSPRGLLSIDFVEHHHVHDVDGEIVWPDCHKYLGQTCRQQEEVK